LTDKNKKLPLGLPERRSVQDHREGRFSVNKLSAKISENKVVEDKTKKGENNK
jgi:hypothetical protein